MPSLATLTTLTLAGESITLLPHRAALWNSTLLIADLHLGKTHSLHTLGIGVPGDSFDESLNRLAALIADTGAARLLILGDLLHAPAGLTPTMIDRVAAWRERHSIDITVVPGNHDRKLESLANTWRFTIAPERLDEGPFTFTHDPVPVRHRYVFGGHLHPAIKLPGGRFPLKLPAFLIGPDLAILPAFSTFSAGSTLRPKPGDRVFAIAGERVVEV
ncbi:hypothetical protein PHYC_00608 [Phycisphaerales bacterium]|nr:hypothetical protein PHYC_00608 [Phycisphaerales bacterium]